MDNFYNFIRKLKFKDFILPFVFIFLIFQGIESNKINQERKEYLEYLSQELTVNKVEMITFSYDKSDWGDGRQLEPPFSIITHMDNIKGFVEAIPTWEIYKPNHPSFSETIFISLHGANTEVIISFHFLSNSEDGYFTLLNNHSVYKSEELKAWVQKLK